MPDDQNQSSPPPPPERHETSADNASPTSPEGPHARPRRSFWAWLMGAKSAPPLHPDYSPEDAEIRLHSGNFIRSIFDARWMVIWQWLALMGGSSQRGNAHVIGLVRCMVILGFGVIFSVAVYSLVAFFMVANLLRSMKEAEGQATARFDQVQTIMQKDFAKDAGYLATVKFEFKPDEKHRWSSGVLWAHVSMPLPDNQPRREESEKLFEVTPLIFPFYHVESRLSAQALTRILVVASHEARGEGDAPDEKAVNRYQLLLQSEIQPGQPSMEGEIARLAKGQLYPWTRRLSGPIQIAIVTLFGCFLATITIRARVDYGFDGWLWRQVGNDGSEEMAVPLYYDLASRFKDESEMLAYFHKVDAAVDEIQNLARCSSFFLDSISLHMRREVVAALCQTDQQRLDAAKGFVEATAKSYSDKFYANTGIARFLLWCLPTAGFVGTTIGIGDALGNANMLQSVSLFSREAGRSIVSTSISVAFDSTFVGLILSMLGMWIIHMVNERQDNYVHEIATEVNDAVTNAKLFRNSSFRPPKPTMPHASFRVVEERTRTAARTGASPVRLFALIIVMLIALTLYLRPDLRDQAHRQIEFLIEQLKPQ